MELRQERAGGRQRKLRRPRRQEWLHGLRHWQRHWSYEQQKRQHCLRQKAWQERQHEEQSAAWRKQRGPQEQARRGLECELRRVMEQERSMLLREPRQLRRKLRQVSG